MGWTKERLEDTVRQQLGEAKLVVVTDAEIFGRYRVQRPRRLKSPHAQATRSALDIDFTELEEGDYVVHVQHGIGRYVGLQVLPPGAGTKPTEGAAATAHSGQECLVIEYAPTDPAQPAPRVQVSFRNGQLKVWTEKATLAEVLNEIHRQTGADIAIPSGAEQDQVVANYEHGVLTLHIRKSEETKSHTIPLHIAKEPTKR